MVPPVAASSSRTDIRTSTRQADLVCVLILAAVCVVMFLTAPQHGEFWWSETSRNALDGAFVHDLIRDLPLSDPKGWAVRYYLQYPALTILFYPPLFHVVLGFAYFVFGVSDSAAVGCTVTFAFAAAVACYAIVRRFASLPTALLASLLLLASPAFFLWSQQVMLDTPAVALSLWAAFFALRYGDKDRPLDLWIALGFLEAALYTKETASLPLLGVFFAVILWKGLGIFRRRHVLIAAAAGVIALAPLLAIKLMFNQWSFTRVGGGLGDDPYAGLAGVFYFAGELAPGVGYPVLALALAWVIGAFWRKDWRLPRGDLLVLSLWFIVTYAVLTAIPGKEARLVILLIPPVVIAASLCVSNLLAPVVQRPAANWRTPFFGALGIAAFGWTAIAHPTPVITGYREAADRVGELAPQKGRVVFAGPRDGSFIFNLRQYHNDRNLTVIRADKLYLNVAVFTENGLNPKSYTEAEIASMLNSLGASYVVTVPHIWADEAEVMANFAKVLESPQFEEVGRFPVTGDAAEKEVVVYHNKGSLKDPPDDFGVDLAIVGAKLGN